MEPSEIIDAGDDRVLAVHYERGRGRGSGTPFERRSATLYTLRADKVARLQYLDTREDTPGCKRSTESIRGSGR